MSSKAVLFLDLSICSQLPVAPKKSLHSAKGPAVDATGFADGWRPFLASIVLWDWQTLVSFSKLHWNGPKHSIETCLNTEISPGSSSLSRWSSSASACSCTCSASACESNSYGNQHGPTYPIVVVGRFPHLLKITELTGGRFVLKKNWFRLLIGELFVLRQHLSLRGGSQKFPRPPQENLFIP